MSTASLPTIIQGGMGVGVSNWALARAVALQGQMGVVSGTALDSVIVRRLQDGDVGGHVRRAMAAFPVPSIAAEALRRYFRPEGRAPGEPYRMLPMYRQVVDRFRNQLTVLANFVEVYLAREGHEGAIGINFLTKIQLPTLASLYGAILAGVDYVLMGAGIPKEIPGVLDRLSNHERASLRLDVEGPANDEPEEFCYDPGDLSLEDKFPLRRPSFLAIIASNSLATMLTRKANGRVDGFVIEGPTAGGHNAPPRGKGTFNTRGEPIYGERDEVDLAKIAELGLPFWIAGGTGRPGALNSVRQAGGVGIQVGTLFAYCEESGLDEKYKASILEQCRTGEVDVYTDGVASPTGFPFKTVSVEGSVADPDTYASRKRICDLGYLRTAYRTPEGKIGYRCPAEPVEDYVRKGGAIEDTVGRRCLCNSLMSNIGHAQVRKDGSVEPPLVTSGDDLKNLGEFLQGRRSYTAAEAIAYLLS